MSRIHATAAAVTILPFLSAGAFAQQGTQQYRCVGDINNVASQAVVEVSPGGLYTEGPAVAGVIQNQFASYSFTGTLFGGTEGYVSLVEQRRGERFDRVWIGISQFGFGLRTEDGTAYIFHCGE